MAWALLTAPIAEEHEERGFVVIQPAPSLRERGRAWLRRFSKGSAEASPESFDSVPMH
jgi:hypothetical protein